MLGVQFLARLFFDGVIRIMLAGKPMADNLRPSDSYGLLRGVVNRIVNAETQLKYGERYLKRILQR